MKQAVEQRGMKLHVISDLHLEFEDYVPKQPDCDVVIVAGDVRPGSKGIHWLKDVFPNHPVVYVAGNHEYYGYTLPRLNEHLKLQSAGSNVHFLQNESLVIGDTLFVGGTLWTNFNLYGTGALSEVACQRGMADFRLIRTGKEERFFTTADARKEFETTLSFLKETLMNLENKKIVVVTHHAPSEISIAKKFKDHPLNPAYASNLESFVMDTQPLLWVHGHIHAPCNYRIGNTRIVCNPRGLPEEQPSSFDPSLVLEI